MWLKPNPGTTDLLIDAIAAEIVNSDSCDRRRESPGVGDYAATIGGIDIAVAAEKTGVSAKKIHGCDGLPRR